MIEIIAGWDEREVVGYYIAQHSILRLTSEPVRFIPLVERTLRRSELYWRRHEVRNGQMWDAASNAPMSTSFANSRFLVPWLASQQWTLFADFADMLWLDDPVTLFELADERYAVMVVKRDDYQPAESNKMDGQAQTVYPRKNWSSMVLWNNYHHANAKLTLDMVNELPGRDLHRFCWLEDDEIGALPRCWNYLVGVDTDDIRPSVLHFTTGTPEVGRISKWSDVWMRELRLMDATRNGITVT